MRTYLLRFGMAALLGAMVLAGCKKNLSDQTGPNEISSQVVVPPGCGNSMTVNMEDLGGFVSGAVQITNDATNYYIKISETLADYDIGTVKLLYGDSMHVRTGLQGLIQCGFQSPANPDLVVNYSPEQDEVLITLPIASIPMDCFWFHARVTVVKRDPGTGNVIYAYDLWTDGTVNASQNACQDFFKYCRQACEEEDCGQLHTQTPGGWGAEPHGNNPGSYLHANFAAAFPTGLRIGCMGGYTITMTNAQAITNLLPTGGQAAVLKASATNPTNIKNVLVGHLIALTLSLRFDVVDADFGDAGVNLGNMIIGSGPFAGKTVNEFMTIANNVIGGCSTAYSIGDILTTATLINENYVDGKTDKGYLDCPEDGTR